MRETQGPLAGVSGDVGAWMTQAEAWKQEAVKAQAEVERLTKELAVATGLIDRNVGTIAASLKADLAALTEED